MNTGIEDYNTNENKLKIDEIKKYLPDIKILEESPKSCFSNYLIVWGFNNINLNEFFDLKTV